MVSVRKRRQADRDASSEPPPPQQQQQPELPSTLVRLRNMWQFACLCQWFYIFGSVVKVDNLDIEELEAQCLSPHSTALQEIGLALLKYLSSHRSLTHEMFEEYTRRQYASKAPELPNPFGTEEVPVKFSSLSVFEKIRILHQMTLFVMMNPEKLRDKMAEQKDVDHDQTTWRIEPFGWDRDDRIYYVLDDNRVYRLTEAPPPPPKPKSSSRKARAQARRQNKRRRISAAALDNAADGTEDESEMPEAPDADAKDEEDGLGGRKWECVAVSLADLHALLASIPGKKDPNERILHAKLVEHLLPILEQQEERRRKREKEREKELLNLAKLATAKRSSRIASRQEQLRQEEMEREEAQKRRLELEAQQKEEQKRRKMERERENRLLSRERRLREREMRRALHKEELAQLSEDSKSADGTGAGRMSERQRLAEIQRAKDALRELEEEGDEEWAFDCICGLHGKVDDGQHSVSCERCNIWQHSRCLGIAEAEAERDDFHFVCGTCKRKAEAAENALASPRPTIKIKVNKPAAETGPSEPPAPLAPLAPLAPRAPLAPLAPLPPNAPNGLGPKSISIPTGPPAAVPLPAAVRAAAAPDTQAGPAGASHAGMNGGSVVWKTAPAYAAPEQPRAGDSVHASVPVKVDSSASLGPAPGAGAAQNGHANLFAMPHPGLSQPDQSPRKSQAYGTIYESPLAGSRGDGGDLGPPTPAPSASQGSAQLAQAQRTPTAFATPRLHHPRDEGQAVRPSGPGDPSDPVSSPLLPTRGGLSPTKTSPTVARDPAGGPLASTSPAPPILPPSAALSPAAPAQNLTPPVKPEGLAHKQSFSNLAAAAAATAAADAASSPPTAG